MFRLIKFRITYVIQNGAWPLALRYANRRQHTFIFEFNRIKFDIKVNLKEDKIAIEHENYIIRKLYSLLYYYIINKSGIAELAEKKSLIGVHSQSAHSASNDGSMFPSEPTDGKRIGAIAPDWPSKE